MEASLGINFSTKDSFLRIPGFNSVPRIVMPKIVGAVKLTEKTDPTLFKVPKTSECV